MGDVPASLEDIKRRRAIAAALATRSRPFPKTIGEGLTSLGEAYGDVMADRRLTAQEADLRRRSLAELNPTAGAVPAVAAPTARPIVPPVAAPAPAAPIAPVARVTTPPAAPDPRDLIARAEMARQGIAGPSTPQPAREVASPDPTLAGEQPPQALQTATASEGASPTAGGDDDPVWAARQGAIGGIESRGQPDPYQAVGAPTKYGRGLGRYQVVEANIGPWTQAALGQALTPQQYLASPQAQDAVFRHRFGQYVDQFGEEGAARAWFGGPGNVNKGDLTDVHKRLSIADYGKSYMAGLQAGTDPTRVAAYAPAGTATDAPSPAARGGMAIPPLAEENPVTPSDIMPAPRVMAEIKPPGGSGVVPGAAPATPASAAPGAYRPPEPVPPVEMRRIPPTPDEVRATRALIIDPENQAAAYLLQQAQAERKRMEESEKIRYQADVNRYEGQRKEKETWLAGEENRQEERKKRQEADALRAAYGNLPEPVRKHLEESTTTAKTAAGAIEAARDARVAMEAGTVFGAGAEYKLQLYRAAAAAGNEDAQRIVAATQTFNTSLGPIIQATIKAYAGKDVSSSELKFVTGMAGGDISRDKLSAERMLNIAERAANETLRSHKATVDTMLGGQVSTAHPVLRSLYGVREPAAGMAIPTAAPARPVVDVRSEEEANRLPLGSRFRLNGRTGTVQ
jgi:hypothetical protein